MPQILVENLQKRFRVGERLPGTWGAVRGLVARRCLVNGLVPWKERTRHVGIGVVVFFYALFIMQGTLSFWATESLETRAAPLHVHGQLR
jgi:hypothetical protein